MYKRNRASLADIFKLAIIHRFKTRDEIAVLAIKLETAPETRTTKRLNSRRHLHIAADSQTNHIADRQVALNLPAFALQKYIERLIRSILKTSGPCRHIQRNNKGGVSKNGPDTDEQKSFFS